MWHSMCSFAIILMRSTYWYTVQWEINWPIRRKLTCSVLITESRVVNNWKYGIWPLTDNPCTLPGNLQKINNNLVTSVRSNREINVMMSGCSKIHLQTIVIVLQHYVVNGGKLTSRSMETNAEWRLHIACKYWHVLFGRNYITQFFLIWTNC